MLKNLRRKNQEKDRLHLDVFKYSKICEHGYLHRPNAITYNSDLQLLAIGTIDGRIKVFGKPGVETEVQSADSAPIQQLIFVNNLPGSHIVSISNNGEQNSLYLWKISIPMVQVKSCTIEGRISICCLSNSRECLYIGTEGGHIYVLDLNSFVLKDHVIYQDVVMKCLPSDVVTYGGCVEDIKEHIRDDEKILIGYQKGLIVLWNQDKIKIESYFVAKQYLESIFWNNDCSGFISSQENGSLCLWSLPESGECGTLLEQSTPFGPFPCKAILKVVWHDPVIVFSGGLPRASYSDKQCITIMEDNAVQTVLDFTSKVVDFVTVKEPLENLPSLLIVLCEEEIVVVDLKSAEKNFSPYSKPYLACIHSSNISTSTHVYECPHDLWSSLKAAGQNAKDSNLSTNAWPITGGNVKMENSTRKDIVITGHDDGTVKFWDTSHSMFTLLCTIHTTKLFREYDGPPPEDPDDDDWPPFKKVCSFDPYVDDSRFVIQKILLCPVAKILLIGGSGGQIIVYELGKTSPQVNTIKSLDINVIEDLVGFEWKGAGPLTLATGNELDSQFVPSGVLQLRPSAPITALSMDTGSGLMAFGTCHGFVLYDHSSHKVVLVKCTVNPTDLANTGAGIQRKRTITKSLRDSFRRLRSRRKSAKARQKSMKAGNASPGKGAIESYNEEATPVSRLIDESRVDEAVLSMVRCLYFGETYLGDSLTICLTLWAGTNAGYIYVYSVTVDRSEGDKVVKTEVGKELKLKHHAPVVNIVIIDKDGVPVGSRSEREIGRISQPDMSGGHSLLILSEEQLKIFSLPTLRPRNKEKLTAIDGSRLRKTGIIEVHVEEEGVKTTHHCLVCLTNQGDVIVYSIPFLKQQFKANITKREDIRAISTMLFTRLGEIFYMKSPSALQRSSILPNIVVTNVDANPFGINEIVEANDAEYLR